MTKMNTISKESRPNCNDAHNSHTKMELIIFGQTPSKKNSRQIFRNRHTGRPFITTSDNYKKWHEPAIIQLNAQKTLVNWNYPVRVSMKFYRESKRRWDYNNISQAILDCLVETGIIIDDDAEHCIPVFIGYEIDKERPRCEIIIEEVK